MNYIILVSFIENGIPSSMSESFDTSKFKSVEEAEDVAKEFFIKNCIDSIYGTQHFKNQYKTEKRMRKELLTLGNFQYGEYGEKSICIHYSEDRKTSELYLEN